MRNGRLVALALIVCFGCVFMALAAADSNPPAIDEILAVQAIKNYTDEAVSDADLETILLTGACAPSARNGQPWHFTVVRDAQTLSDLGAGSGVMIVISGADAVGGGTNVAFDCALATQNMYLAAGALGLGANITMSPVSRAAQMSDALQIPEGYTPLMALTVGHYEADGVTAATGRKDVAEVVNYVE